VREPLNRKALGLFALAALMIALSIPRLIDWRRLVRLADRGEVVPAKITSSASDTSGKYSSDVINFEFQPTGEKSPRSSVDHYTLHDLSGADPSEISRGFSHQTLSARYLPDDPAINRLDVFFPQRIAKSRFDALLFLGIGLALGFGGGVILRR
jgi:hypothetical protein